MGHQMFDYDAQLAEAVFEYCRERLSMDPVPLDYGSQMAIPSEKLAGLMRPQGNSPEEILDFFKTTLAPAVVSIDSPSFLAFIPNAPTKNSLLFDMVVACSGLNGTSWLESSGVVVAENQALSLLAETAGLPESSGGRSSRAARSETSRALPSDATWAARSGPISTPATCASLFPVTLTPALAKPYTSWTSIPSS
jgi:hypothetical protein